MNDTITSQKRSVVIEMCRWMARLITLNLVVIVVFFTIPEGGLDLLWKLPSSSFLFVSLFGLMVGWKWEGIGGGLSITGVFAFQAIHVWSTGRYPGGWVFPAMYLPGAMYLTAAIWTWKYNRPKSS